MFTQKLCARPFKIRPQVGVVQLLFALTTRHASTFLQRQHSSRLLLLRRSPVQRSHTDAGEISCPFHFHWKNLTHTHCEAIRIRITLKSSSLPRNIAPCKNFGIELSVRPGQRPDDADGDAMLAMSHYQHYRTTSHDASASTCLRYYRHSFKQHTKTFKYFYKNKSNYW